MKKYTLLSLSLFFAVTAFSQVTISYDNNALVSGDSVSTREIRFVEPGGSGPGQVWDFSKIQYTENNPVSHVLDIPGQKPLNVSKFNLLLNEFGYDYYFNINKYQMEEVALSINGVSLVYTDPIIKMKYPFVFGQHYTDKFAGLATYPDNRTIEISGDYTVDADAFGTLILPDGIIKDILRLRVEKNGSQVNVCGTTVTKSVRYMWYAPGARYPVLSTNITEIKTTGREPKITKTAFANRQKNMQGTAVSGLKILTSGDLPEVSAVVYPSPFKKMLNYQYFLPAQMPVNVELYTMDGKKNITLVKNQLQPGGLHTGEIDASDYVLTPGVYFLRFTFDKKVIVSKVVKMQ